MNRAVAAALATLAALLPLTVTQPATAAAADERPTSAEVHSFKLPSPYARTVFFLTNRMRCTGSLVGNRTVLTAAHCIAAGGTRDTKITAYLGHRYTRAGRATWLYKCRGSRAWAADLNPAKMDSDDWGFFDIVGCRTRSGSRLRVDPGVIVGYHGIREYGERDDDILELYAGYPRVPRGGGKYDYGRLRYVLGHSTERPLVKLLPVLDTWRFARLDHPVDKGGSGGGLLQMSEEGGWFWLHGIDVFMHSNDAHFLEVTAHMEKTTIAAREGNYPRGTWKLRRRGRS